MNNNDKELNNQHPSEHKRGLPEVPLYSNMLSANRRNVHIDGFDFDVDTFENLIDNFTPINNIPLILSGTSGKRYSLSDMDKFCNIVYKMPFDSLFCFILTMTLCD